MVGCQQTAEQQLGLCKGTVVAAYRCPSDGGRGGVNWMPPEGTGRIGGVAPNAAYAHNNYVGCIGDDVELRNSNPRGIMVEGMWTSVSNRGQANSMADIVDGTSNTLMVSECIIGFPRQDVNSPYAAGQVSPTANGCPVPGTLNTSSTKARKFLVPGL